jgi:hypothetical protein
MEKPSERADLPPFVREFASLAKGQIQRIRTEMARLPLPRTFLRTSLLDVEKMLERLKIQGTIYVVTVLWKFYPATEYPPHPITGKPLTPTLAGETFGKMVDSDKRSLRKILGLLEEEKEDTKVLAALEKYLRPKEQLLTWIEELSALFFNRAGLTAQSMINELIGIAPAGVDENWAAAVCYLSSMEPVIDKKFRELGLKKEEKEGFQGRFQKVVMALRGRGVQVSELDVLLQGAFWELRHKVIHEGYRPSFEETVRITNWVKKVLALSSSA